MIYRLAKETDIDKICSLIENAINNGKSRNISVGQLISIKRGFP